MRTLLRIIGKPLAFFGLICYLAMYIIAAKTGATRFDPNEGHL